MDTKNFRFSRDDLKESMEQTVQALKVMCKQGNDDSSPIYITSAALKVIMIRVESWQKMLDDVTPEGEDK